MWIHKSAAPSSLVEHNECVFCRRHIQTFEIADFLNEEIGVRFFAHDEDGTFLETLVGDAHLSICRACGWWHATAHSGPPLTFTGGVWYTGSVASEVAVLDQLDLTEIEVPLSEVRSYLLAKESARFGMNPSLFEKTVASVFGDLGYRTLVTGRTGDGGIDVVLYGEQGDRIGVQVKRYRNKLGVSQIREFLGALVLDGTTRGLLVATSSFTRGASQAAAQSQVAGVAAEIELVDGERFLDALGLVQEKVFQEDRVYEIARHLLFEVVEDTPEGHSFTEWDNYF